MKAIVRGSVYACAILIIGAGGRVRLLRLFPIGTSVPFPASVITGKPTCTWLSHNVRKKSHCLASYFDNFHIFDSCPCNWSTAMFFCGTALVLGTYSSQLLDMMAPP